LTHTCYQVMPSIIEGYNYDIFISYRQKDNKGDRWVSQFVEALRTELESTFKEEISVYFDFNPYDGLLETHDVDESLKEKLKCLIFIPIISRTYCDPKAFAWENEFKAFVEQASKDDFGLRVRLPSGNVASRVLPVRIHDLDFRDNQECESVLGGPLRGVEFIYKSPGVNRPLRSREDSPNDNINKTFYRDQINKMALAIKEIITTSQDFRSDSKTQRDYITPDSKINIKSPDINIKKKSIIVLPFSNLSPDKHDEYFSDGLTEEIITRLAYLKSLRVISRSTSMFLKGTLKDIKTIGRELEVNYVLEGSVRKSGNKIRITGQLIDALNDEHLWVEKYDGTTDDIFYVQDQIAKKIVDELKIEITPIEKKEIFRKPIKHPKAYDLWIIAKHEFHKLDQDGIERGIYLIRKALEYEGDNAQLYATLGQMYWGAYDMGIIHDSSTFDKMEECIKKSLELNPDQTGALYVKGLLLYKKGQLAESLKYTRPNADQGGDALYFIPFLLAELGKFDEALKYVEKTLKNDPLAIMSWWAKAGVDLFMGQPKKAYNQLKETRDKMTPGEPFVGWWVAQMAAYAGETKAAYEEFQKIANSDSLPWKEFCRLFQLAIDKDHNGVIEHLKISKISEIAKTDEYFPIFIANALSLVEEMEEALSWLKRAVDWGFSNYKFLTEYNKFFEPLRSDPNFIAIIDQARKQHYSLDL